MSKHFRASAVALLTAVGSSACRSPTDPTKALNLAAGLQVIQFIGMSISSDPLLPPCTPLAMPPAGPGATLRAILQRENDDWVARSRPGEGTVELRIHATGGQGSLGASIAGTVSGGGKDVGFFIPPNDVTVNLDGDGGKATVEGEVWRGSRPMASGRIVGRVTFSDPKNAVGECSAIQWLMQPSLAGSGN